MAKGFKKVGRSVILDTWLQGRVRVTYAKLQKIFGVPRKGDKDKTDAEWHMQFSDGTVASIYNYKDGKAYLGREGKPVNQITDWHIGGKSKKAVTLVKAALQGKL